MSYTDLGDFGRLGTFLIRNDSSKLIGLIIIFSFCY
jgi:hypothetical protein